MPNQNYYPRIIEILPVDRIPDSLSAVEDGLTNVLNSVFFKNLEFSISRNGASGFYSLQLFTYNPIGFNIPGTELKLVLNPDLVDGLGTTSVISVNLSYDIPIIAFLSSFNITNFSASPKAYFDLLLEIFEISIEDLVKIILEEQFSDSANAFQSLLDDFNTQYNKTIQYSDDPLEMEFEDVLDEFIEIISTEGDPDIFDTIFNTFVTSISSISLSFEKLENILKRILPRFSFEDVLRILKPSFEFQLHELSLGLTFPTNLFKRVDPISLEPLLDSNGNFIQSILKFNAGAVRVSSDGGFVFQNTSSISFPISQILNSGFYISVIGAKLDLSRTSNIPEAIADGRPDDFIGAYITEGIIGFPAFWNHSEANSTAQLVTRNLLIGTGGISGTIGMEAITEGIPSPLIQANFGGGFNVSLDAFFIRFQQNAIIESTIHGSMKIPGFKDSTGADALINIDAWIGTNGEFSVTASEDQGITALKIPGVLDVRVDSLTVGRQNDRFYVAVAGAINFVAQEGFLGQFIPEAIEVQKLLIWQDGQIEFEGGGLVLPRAVSLQLGPVKLSITAIGFGAHRQTHQGVERKYKFFEFSGGVSITPGGVDARGDGVKFYYTVDNDSVAGLQPHRFVRIQGIGIDLVIPSNATPNTAALLLSGYLSMKDPEPGNEAAGTEYAGGVSFTLPRLKMGGSASMRINPKVPAFIVDVGLEIKLPILLGTTGLGIYGFRALVGQRYVATKTAAGVPEDGAWWQYYKAKIAPDYKEGVQVSKFSQTKGFSMGAGVSLATAPDAGLSFSSKLFFMLSLPEVFLFQGQAQILRERIGLDSPNDPPFFALIAVSSQSIEAAFGMNYNVPDIGPYPGAIAKIDALFEMGFFFGNSSAWYINIGKDEPYDRRINVRMYSLFNSYFYLMLSSSGIRAGAGSNFEVSKSFGPISASLGAYLDMEGRISFKPKQIGASIQLGGHVDVKLFKLGLSIHAAAALSAEAPQPFIITGMLKIGAKILNKTYDLDFEFTWTRDLFPNLDENLIIERTNAANAVHILTAETFEIYNTEAPLSALTPADLDDFIVPVDSFIDIEFKHGVLPSSQVNGRIGGNTQGVKYTDFVSPQKAKFARVRHEYHLNQLNIYIWNGSSWVNYDPYEAATPLTAAPFVTANFNTLKHGYWQAQKPNLHNKLRILSQTPLSYMSQATGAGVIAPNPLEELGFTGASFFCPEEPIGLSCINFQHYGELESGFGTHKLLKKQKVYQLDKMMYAVQDLDSEIVYQPYNGNFNAIQLKGNQVLTLVFAESMAQLELLIQSEADEVEIRFYKNEETGMGENNLPQFQYTLIDTILVSQQELNDTVDYNDMSEPVDKVEIQGLGYSESNGTLVCDTTVTDVAKALQHFLNVHAQNSHLTQNITLYPNLDTIYNGVYQYSPLFTNEPIRMFKVVNSNTSYILNFTITDTHYTCNFQLTSEERITWSNITEFSNIRPLHPVSGNNNAFQIDVLVNNKWLTIEGVSCHNIINCSLVCDTHFYKLCYLTFADALNNATIPDLLEVQNETNAMSDAINGAIQPVWRPNSYFAIEIATDDQLYRNTSTTLLENYARNQIFAFKTVGPTGFYHQTNLKYNALLSQDREMEFKLSGLMHYIDYTKSYPNADGALINAKPLFYQDPELQVFYTKPYVFEMYKNWDSYQNNPEVSLGLNASILDPAPEDLNSPEPFIATEWLVNDLPGFSQEVEVLNNLIANSSPCVVVNPLNPMGVNAKISCGALKPLKLYTALFTASHKPNPSASEEKEEVHRFVFQTSQYANFEEQVNSYILLTDENDSSIVLKKAVYHLIVQEVDTNMIATIIAAIDDTLSANDNLRLEYANPMERLLDGVLKLGAQHPAMTTEFNLVKSENDDILGVLVRNPEPFNDPKIPEIEQYNTLDCEINGVSLNKKLFSRDNRTIFLTNTLANLPTGLGEFTFRYKQWSGNAYTTLSTITLAIDIN